ncbi:hypothetical protein [Flavobacterium restrictum]|uniref:Uncharacterized protein n=1 Tax=Flavobacterium restrictum TaxID=2594428 RepID=A0A553E7V5_9FLAO|nr:hypothetical protein [Flavobacterium restrictum]TRX40913.1 hypothetical protein FNW21_06335 [Flavobacterium restrictum]
MRTTVFIITFFVFLLGGGNSLYANTKEANNSCFSISANLLKNKPLQFSNDDQKITLFDETDLDTEEDFHSSNDRNDSGKNLSYTTKYKALTPWYTLQSKLFVLNYYNNRFEITTPFLGTSYPIYISQRVLRI